MLRLRHDPWPILDSPNALELLALAEAGVDDAGTLEHVTQMHRAVETLATARRAVAQARDAGVRASAEASVGHAKLAVRCALDAATTNATVRMGRATEAMSAVLTAAMSRPAGADPAATEIRAGEIRRQLAAVDPAERERMALHMARTGESPEILRALLTAPRTPWSTSAFPTLLTDRATKAVQEQLFARVQPQIVRDLRAAWRLETVMGQAEAALESPYPAGGAHSTGA